MKKEVLHFRVGADAGILLMNLVNEYLHDYNYEKALKVIIDSLMGIDKELALKILCHEYVITCNEEEQLFDLEEYVNRPSGYREFILIDFLDKQGEKLQKEIRQLKTVCDQIRFNRINVKLTARDIIDPSTALKKILEDDEVITKTNVLRNILAFIEKVKVFRNMVDWFQLNGKINAKQHQDIIDYTIALSDLDTKVSSILDDKDLFEESQQFKALESYIDASIEISKIKTITPVNIMDNYSAGWLSQDGKFYGLNGEFANMLHNSIATLMYESGLIPKSEENESQPDSWLEQQGYVKIHGNWILYAGYENLFHGVPNIPISKQQKEIIFDYIMNCHQSLMLLGYDKKRKSAGMWLSMNESDIEEVFNF